MRRFIFDKRWMNRVDVMDVVKEAWNIDCEGSRMFRVAKKIKACLQALISRNKSNHVNVAKKIEETKQKLEKLRK